SCKVFIENKNGSEIIEADKILLAVGRTPNTEEIGLETIGIKTDNGFIPVDQNYQTSVKTVYAIGDIVNSPQLAHVASKEGIIAVEHIAGRNPERLDPLSIPSAVYCEPQLAGFGYTEERLVSEKIEFKKEVFPFAASGKATAIEKREGITKILYSNDQKKILGVHIVGEDATELIHQFLIIKQGDIKAKDAANILFAHPTLSEITLEIARAMEGWPIHG
ncbi:MAG: FAD-dependent oxidoreductase, partial [Spirochaetes bacterium]|nr:FAD-dependent oxidoreductase [Spirochaetota bacterium]